MPFRNNQKFIDIIRTLNLMTNLQLCLDAGDAASYAGGTKWLDVSGNGNDFWLGTDATAIADPTFTGTSGDLKDSTYFLNDGSSYFTTVAANPTWVKNISKDSSTHTLATWFYNFGLGSTQDMAGTDAGAPTNFGWYFTIRNTNVIAFQAENGVTGYNLDSTATVKVGWNFLAISVDEASSVGITHVNGVNETQAYNYAAPSANDPTFAMNIGCLGNGTTRSDANSRMGAFMGWSRALSAAELMSLWQYPYGIASDTPSIQRINRMVGY